jgi:type II secretory pathway pseudopilin PulG
LDSKGITLVETLITIALIGIAMALLAKMMFAGNQAWQNQWARVKMESQAQKVITLLTYNLRQAVPNTVAISNQTGEMNNSMITFNRTDGSGSYSFYMKSLMKGTTVMEREVVFTAPASIGSANPVTNVLATDVLALYFTYPNLPDTSRVIANISMYKHPLNATQPVFFQSQETIYIRN